MGRLVLDRGVVICCCADGTLTVWRKALGWEKPMPAALPAYSVDDPAVAEYLIRQVCSLSYTDDAAALAQDAARARPVVSVIPFRAQDPSSLFEVSDLLAREHAKMDAAREELRAHAG